MRSLLLLALASLAFGHSFQIQPSQIAGIELIGPDSPEFTTLLPTVVPDEKNRAILAPALPFSFIARNVGPRAIRLMTVRFDYTSNVTMKPVAGTISEDYENSFGNGGLNLYTPSGSTRTFGLQRNYANALRNLSQMQASPIVKASVDSVTFDDGTFAGPDRAGQFERLSLESKGLRELIKELQALEGKPTAALRDHLAQISKEDRPRLGNRPIISRTSSARMLLGVLDNVGRSHMQQVLADMAANPPAPEVRKQ